MKRDPFRSLGLPKTIGLLALTLFAFGAVDQFADELTPRRAPPIPTLQVPAGLVGDEWSGGPRECDAARGVTTACVFMD